MQPTVDDQHFSRLIDLTCNYFQGKGGDNPTKAALDEATRLRKAHEKLLACEAAGKDLPKNNVLVNFLTVYKQVRAMPLKGDPEKDWQKIRDSLENGACKRLREIAKEVRNLRILGRGAQLRQLLAQDWRDNGGYHNALTTTRQAFVQEHFSTKTKSESGVVVMNMHKAKGKQFDEVIIFEGWPRIAKGKVVANLDRIVWNNYQDNVSDQSRQNMRVSVTRAKIQTTILTPSNDPCILLLGEK